MLDLIKRLIEHKKVLILGFGREGRSSLAVIRKAGGYAALGISDQSAVNLEEQDCAKITLHIGKNYQKAIDEYDVVFKSPGVVLEKPAQEYSARIVSQTEIFFQRYKNQIIGITGTKGKSTTATLLYHILKESGRDCMLAGNIGIPVFEHYEDITDHTCIVVELSCHQLEYMDVSPHIGVLINIHEEHLDHYGTMEKYVAAKQNIYRYQEPGDVLFCNADFLPEEGTCKSMILSVGVEEPEQHPEISEVMEKSEQHPEISEVTEEPEQEKHCDIILRDHLVLIPALGKEYIIPKGDIKLLGHHNFFNIAIVYGICLRLGVNEEDFSRALKTYQPLPHRLQFIGRVNGINYYDDSISTMGTATIEALKALQDTDAVLIGGMDRGIDYDDLIAYLNTSDVPEIILMEATGKRIYKEMMDLPGGFQHPERIFLAEHLEDAVALAKQKARMGHSCLLSPAAASYGIFKNFEERGEAFARLVREDKETGETTLKTAQEKDLENNAEQ